jgi:hypothetical protein
MPEASQNTIGSNSVSDPQIAKADFAPNNFVPLWKPIAYGAMAGGLGWGIRGQYGHETGAMIAGVLVSLVMVLLFRPVAESLTAARTVAWSAIAFGFGGSMTYGQTVGLTHDAPLVGNWAALSWGMLGLAIKGGIWIGFGAAFLGMGLSGTRHRARELLLLMFALLAASVLGVWTLNSPFDPAQKILPAVYFSDSWHWEPGADLKPRREVWGGLLFALAGLVVHTGWIRRDPLAPRLAFWGFIAGAAGFPLGQSLQAAHAWNSEFFRSGLWGTIDPLINWWNFMETTFGAVMGAILGFGLWLNRARIAPLQEAAVATIPKGVEWLLLVAHVTLLIISEFFSVSWINSAYDFGIIQGLIPIVLVAAGRYAPFLMILPITLLPIAGKTIRQLVYREHALSVTAAWILYFVLPLLLTTVVAVIFARSSVTERNARRFLLVSLLLSVWLYFGLNFAFFHYPWPWSTWTQRTANGIVFVLCASGLTPLLRASRAVREAPDLKRFG